MNSKSRLIAILAALFLLSALMLPAVAADEIPELPDNISAVLDVIDGSDFQQATTDGVHTVTPTEDEIKAYIEETPDVSFNLDFSSDADITDVVVELDPAWLGAEASLRVACAAGSVEIGPGTLADLAKASGGGVLSFAVGASESGLAVSVKKGDDEVEFYSYQSPMTIAIPLKLDADDNGSYAVACSVQDDAADYIPLSLYADGFVTAKVYAAGVFTASLQEPEALAYGDLAAHWAEKAVYAMAARDITVAGEEGVFAPSKAITRGEFIVLLVDMLDLKADLDEEGFVKFVDVEEDDAFYVAANTAKYFDVAAGIGDDKFNPNAGITRQDVATLICKGLIQMEMIDIVEEDGIDAALEKFSDAADITDYARERIAACSEAGIMNGNANGTFNPKGAYNNAEAIATIWNIIQGQF